MRRPRRPEREPGVSEQRKSGHVYLQWDVRTLVDLVSPILSPTARQGCTGVLRY